MNLTTNELSELLGVWFSDEQLAAITAPLRPGVIIAGAGTGKTTVMAARVVWLGLTGQVRPEQVLGLTFTRKAALELSQRIDTAWARALPAVGTGADEGRQLVTTYDAFAGRLLADHGLRVGAEADQTLITGATRYRLAAQAVASVSGRLPALGQLRPATLADRLLKLDAELRSHLVDPDQVTQTDLAFAHELGEVRHYRGAPTKAVQQANATIAGRAELLRLVEQYRQLKHERGLTEFADQMALATKLAETSATVASLVRDRFAVVLLDEYQDTSAAQARLLRALFSGPSQSSGRGFPLTAVGDPFQAIYGWRGAAPSNILQFPEDFPQADGSSADRFALRINRRSRPAILAAANALSEPLRADQRLGGADQLLRAPAAVTGGHIRVASFETWPQEVAWVADQVVAAHLGPRPTPWSEISVLTRGNAPIGALYAELVARDVPVEIVGLGGLLEVPEIADIVATLQLIDEVGANPEVVRLLSGPRWRIGPRDLAVLGRRARELQRADRAARAGDIAAEIGDQLEPTSQLCLLDAVDDLGTAPLSTLARARLARFSAELAELRRHRDEPLLELVHRVIEASGVGRELAADPETHATGQVRQLARFADAVAGYVDIDGDGALSGLLAWLAAERDRFEGLDQAVPSNDDSVKLLTVHRAKGLEWEVVFLPGLCAGTFPSTLPPDCWTSQPAVLPAELRGDADWVPQLMVVTSKELSDGYRKELALSQRQAEDRLIYVASTRARSELVASCHYWAADRKTAKKPSDYFRRLADDPALPAQVAHVAECAEENPLGAAELSYGWPTSIDEAKAADLAQAAAWVRQGLGAEASQWALPDADAAELGQRWHQLARALVEQERARRRPQTDVVLPASVSASALMLANRDRADFARQLLRPMPRPAGQASSVGTRFHQWLEKRFGLTALFDDDPAAADDPSTDASAADLLLRRLTTRFERGRYARRTPLCVEEPFILMLGDQQVRGRIDAVFATSGDADHDYQVVDWKTANTPADPLQLSLYRLAWARSEQLPLHRVDAVFYHVLTDEVERPELLDEAELDAMVGQLTGRANLNS